MGTTLRDIEYVKLKLASVANGRSARSHRKRRSRRADSVREPPERALRVYGILWSGAFPSAPSSCRGEIGRGIPSAIMSNFLCQFASQARSCRLSCLPLVHIHIEPSGVRRDFESAPRSEEDALKRAYTYSLYPSPWPIQANNSKRMIIRSEMVHRFPLPKKRGEDTRRQSYMHLILDPGYLISLHVYASSSCSTGTVCSGPTSIRPSADRVMRYF